MSVFNRILCPTDFSEASYLALQLAVDLAADGVSEVCVLHVELDMQEMLMSGAMPTHEAADQRAEAIRTLCAIIEERTPDFVRTNAVLKQGEVVAEIVAVAMAQDADLIVMSTHGAGGHKAVLGSNVTRVLREAPCPVLVINGDESSLINSVASKRSDWFQTACSVIPNPGGG